MSPLAIQEDQLFDTTSLGNIMKKDSMTTFGELKAGDQFSLVTLGETGKIKYLKILRQIEDPPGHRNAVDIECGIVVGFSNNSSVKKIED